MKTKQKTNALNRLKNMEAYFYTYVSLYNKRIICRVGNLY